MTRDYFARHSPAPIVDGPQAASGGRPSEPFVTFVWPLGDVINALVRAGLRIDLVREHALPAIYGGHAGAEWLPALFILRATRV